MPRPGRVDYPGAVHHVMVRGLERKALFGDEEDYSEFKKRLGRALENTKSRCLAWCLMPNHVHILLRSGTEGPSRIMQVLLTGYGLFFNNKRRRAGYVYQGRFKSILCEDEAYFLELVRYVHLNPVRAGIVRNLSRLGDWAWSGHRALLGNEKLVWQDLGEVLGRFGKETRAQRKEYVSFLREGLGQEAPDLDLGGQGLIRALGGLWEGEGIPGVGIRRRVGEETLAGSEEFVQKVLAEVKERDDRRSRLKRMGWTTAKVLARAGDVVGIKGRMIRGAGKEPRQSRGRALASKWLVEDLGRTTVEVGRELRVSQPAVVGAMRRGRILEKDLGVRLEGKGSKRA